MKTSINNIPFILLSFLLMAACGSSTTYDSTKYAILQDSIQKWTEQGEVIGSELLVMENDKKILHRAFGWSDNESQNELNTGSIWTVMSMTKPFTATAILMLVEDGVLTLDDPITNYIQPFNGYKGITIRHLLAQSSGDDGAHGNGGHNVLEFETLDLWIADWAEQKSNGTFNEFVYSNFNYGALAYIVQQVTEMPAGDFIKKRIIEPLNLKNTFVGFAPDSTWAELVPSRYQWNDSTMENEKFWSNDQPQSWKFFTGALGLWMSAEDYSTFMNMWMNDGSYKGVQLLKKSTIREGLKIQANAYGEELFGHGYGWFIDDEPTVFRYGGSAGSVGIAYPDEKTTVIYLTHSAGGDHKSKFQDLVDQVWFPNGED